MTKDWERNDRILSSDLGKARCLNCSHTWGDHIGVRCPRRDGTFQPLGFALSDRCDNCNETLLDHIDRMTCRSNRNHYFEKQNDFFGDKEFMI